MVGGGFSRLALLCSFAAFIAAIPTAAVAEETAEQVLKHFRHSCNGEILSHVEQSACLATAVKRMKIRLIAEYNKALESASAVGSSETIGGRSGAQIAKIERDELIRAERLWELFNGAECTRRSDEIDLGGGNSGDIVGASCELEHMAERIVELEN